MGYNGVFVNNLQNGILPLLSNVKIVDNDELVQFSLKY